jgi:hypothetical protein
MLRRFVSVALRPFRSIDSFETNFALLVIGIDYVNGVSVDDPNDARIEGLR